MSEASSSKEKRPENVYRKLSFFIYLNFLFSKKINFKNLEFDPKIKNKLIKNYFNHNLNLNSLKQFIIKKNSLTI